MPSLNSGAMRQGHPRWNTLGSIWLLAIVTSLLPHVLARDTWLFHTDPLTQGLYLGLLTGFWFLLWAVLGFLVFVLFPAAREWLRRKAMALAGSAFMGVVFVFSFRILFPQAQTSGNLRSALFYGGCFGLAALLMLGHPRRDSVLRRMAAVGRFGFLLWVVGLPIAYMAHKGQDAPNSRDATQKKQVVLLVVDGLPSHLMHTFNPTEPPRLLDSVLAQGRVFTGMTSQHPWTHGWFGTLYSGLPYWRLIDEKEPNRNPNLFGLLQEAGVKARWVVFHRNGVPEGSAARTHNYRGLRTSFLGPAWGDFWSWFNLDYHVLSPDGDGNSLFQGNSVRRMVYQLLNPSESRLDPIQQSLPQEMRRLHRHADRSFLLYHLHWSMMGHAADPALASQTADQEQVFHRIANQDYRYELTDTQAVAAVRKQREIMAHDLDSLGLALQGFLRLSDTDPELKNATVILTADHGTLAERGFLWYARHAEEEVLRVPCVILRGASQGQKAGRFSTPDLAETVFDLLQVEATVGGSSLLKSDGRDTVFALTSPSSLRQEWYLVAYVGDKRWRFNLFAGGPEKWDKHQVLPHFATVPEDSGMGFPAAWQGWIARQIRENGIDSQRKTTRAE